MAVVSPAAEGHFDCHEGGGGLGFRVRVQGLGSVHLAGGK